MAPERLGKADRSLLADSLVSRSNGLEQTVVTRGNVPHESAGPAVPQGVAVGTPHRCLLSQRMSLCHYGLRAGAAGQKLPARARVGLQKGSTSRTFHGAAAVHINC